MGEVFISSPTPGVHYLMNYSWTRTSSSSSIII